MDINFIDLRLNKETVFNEMGYGKSIPNPIIVELVDMLIEEAHNRTNPSFYFDIFFGKLSESRIYINDTVFETNYTITSLLKNSEQFAIFAATAGSEYQKWHEEVSKSGDSLVQYVLDSLGSVIVEACGDYMELYLEKYLNGVSHTNRFSPGYCGWNIIEQKKLFSIMPDNICEIKLNSSSLMVPIKSISGIIGIGTNVENHKYGCQFCELENCYKKRNKKLASN